MHALLLVVLGETIRKFLLQCSLAFEYVFKPPEHHDMVAVTHLCSVRCTRVCDITLQVSRVQPTNSCRIASSFLESFQRADESGFVRHGCVYTVHIHTYYNILRMIYEDLSERE